MSKKIVRDFLACTSRDDLAQFFGVAPSSLTYFAHGKGKKYTSFQIPKKMGGVREISAPLDGLKTMQKKLAQVLSEIYPPQRCVQGFVKNGSTIKNATPHLRKRVVLNIDLKDFFPSITAARVAGLFKGYPFSFPKNVASTLAALCCNDGCLPYDKTEAGQALTPNEFRTRRGYFAAF